MHVKVDITKNFIPMEPYIQDKYAMTTAYIYYYVTTSYFMVVIMQSLYS